MTAAMIVAVVMGAAATNIKSPRTRVIRTVCTPVRMTPSVDRTTVHNVLTFTATATATTAAMEDTATRINSSRRIVTGSCAVTTTGTNAMAVIGEAMDDTTIAGRFRSS